ncbi:MAG: 3-hydroxybutyryl-CoA dehydrogenase [Rhodospirillales bacterium]|jgi:3-hydroxybutyryl-CoA dehydrogenase|nr:3-hydroxybutyryl-CoA dehydrogenase [Rhodospirillales bacterium]
MAVDIKKIGVVGAGQMGVGISHVCAVGGLDVHLVDNDAGRLGEGLAAIEHYMSRQVAKGKIGEADAQAALARITSGTDVSAFADRDLVIEAVNEDEQIKKTAYKEICPHLKPEALLATNTSSISITRLASSTDRPSKFLGMHFMYPAPMLGLVELIRGIATDAETFRAVEDLVERLGKTSVSVEDFSAFIVNRILMPMINEAVYALYEGVASVKAIDTAMRLGCRHPMGPLELADFIGLDFCLAVMNTLHEGLADTKYRPCPLLVKYVEAGWLGRKSGRGFYDYSKDEPEPTR